MFKRSASLKHVELKQNKHNAPSEAFDSVDHSILLKKLSNIGVSEEALNWFESYISNRKQFVRIGSSVSDVQPITHGVPQRAICHHYCSVSI